MEKLTKICIKCNCEKELTEFYFRKITNKHYNTCKDCAKHQAIENNINNKEAIKVRKKQYNEKNRDKIIEKNKIRYENNKDEINKLKREWYYANLDKAKANKLKYYAENKIKLLEQKKQYYISNKEEMKEKARIVYHNTKEESRARHKLYTQKNRSELLAKKRAYNKTDAAKLSSINSNNKRRAIIKDGNVTTEQLANLYKTEKNCYWCKCKLEKNNTHLDHFYPLSKGGKHTLNNLVLTCVSCNLSKYNKDPLDFAKEINVIPHDLEFIL